MKSHLLILFLVLTTLACEKNETASVTSTPAPTPPDTRQKNDKCERIRLSQSINENSDIIGGDRVLATDADAKATAMIISTDSTTGESFICTATPIAPRTLITAAHCLDRATKVTAIFYVDLTCTNGFIFNRDAVRAVDFKWHPNYNPNAMNSDNPDIGLVHLASDVKIGYPIYKINLKPEILNSQLFLYGYGITGSNNSDSTVLRKVRLNRSEYSFELNSIVISNNGVKGICLGDSGGPGFVKSGRELQIATVNSFGYGPRNDVCGGRSSLILLYPYMSFIKDTLSVWHEPLPGSSALPPN